MGADLAVGDGPGLEQLDQMRARYAEQLGRLLGGELGLDRRRRDHRATGDLLQRLLQHAEGGVGQRPIAQGETARAELAQEGLCVFGKA